MLTGDNGILYKATIAKEVTNEAEAKEKVQLAVMSSFGLDGKFDREQFKEEIKKVGGTILSEDEDTVVVEIDNYEATVDAKTGQIISFESSKGVRPEVNVKQELNGDKVIIK